MRFERRTAPSAPPYNFAHPAWTNGTGAAYMGRLTNHKVTAATFARLSYDRKTEAYRPVKQFEIGMRDI